MEVFPNIFEYDNYRDFLKDTYAALKATDKKFSFRYFAKAAGFNSHNFLRLVMRGESNLSEESVDKFSKAFKLNKEASAFFKNLVLFNQATSNEEKKRYSKELVRSRSYKKIHPLKESQYDFFKYWYFSAVREIVSLDGFKEDPHWISKHIIPHIGVHEAKKAIEELVLLGFLKRDDKGKLVQSEPNLGTPDEVQSVYIANWHKEYLKRAMGSIDEIPREKRDISSVGIGLSLESMKIIKEMIQKFRREVMQVASNNQSRNIFCHLNIQLFPIAEIAEEEEKS